MTTTYDVLAFQLQTNNADAVQVLVIGDNNGVLVTGPLKLAQRFILELMTEQGTIQYFPARGTLFVTQLRSGQVQTEIDVFSAFSLALLTIKANLQAEDDTTKYPLNECYQDAAINSISINSGNITLNISVTSLAGTVSNIVLPITFNLLPTRGN